MKNFNQYFISNASSLKNTPIGTIKPSVENLAHGLCFYWAYVFAQITGGTCVSVGVLSKNKDESIFEGNCHMMVFYNGLYYDGDHPQGTSQMPQYDPNSQTIIRHKNPKWAMHDWGWTHSLDQFDKVVYKIQKKISKQETSLAQRLRDCLLNLYLRY